MSNTYTPEGSTNTAAWIVTAGICLGLFALLFWATSGPVEQAPTRSKAVHTIPVPKGMSWPELNIDAKELAQARRMQSEGWKDGSSQDIFSSDELTTLYDKVKSVNDHQFTTHPIPSIERSVLEHDLSLALGDVIAKVKPNDFIHLGEPLIKECNQGLKVLLTDIAADKITLAAAMEDADFNTYGTYRKACGNMLTQLRERGLITEAGTWRDDDAIELTTILQRYRWAHLVNLHVKAIEQLTQPERIVFARWRVEDQQAFDMKSRQYFASRLHTLVPDYPPGLADAMLAYEEGRLEEAAEILSRYKNQSPDSPVYKTMYKSLVEELSGTK